jgi:hypothetical protein
MPRRHKADGGQEELDERWVSLPSGSSRRRRNLQLQSMRSRLASDFVVLVLSPPRRTEYEYDEEARTKLCTEVSSGRLGTSI